MISRNLAIAGAVAAIGITGFGIGVSGDISPFSATQTQTMLSTPQEPNCEFGSGIPTPACFAAGIVRNVSLYNLQGAGQFCVWRNANPGEWTRLKDYASSGATPSQIVTWFGSHIRNDLEAYFATGAPPFTISPNTSPNRCRTPLPAPVVAGVIPGQTDATVTVATTP